MNFIIIKRYNCVLTNLLDGHLPPLNSFGARHHYFMCGWSSEVVFWDTLGMGGSGVSAASIPVLALFQVRYWKGLCAKTRCQVFERSDVLIHDLLSAQPPPVDSMLLESSHKVCKHSSDPDFSQEVVFRDVFGKWPGNAAHKAVKKRETPLCYLDPVNISDYKKLIRSNRKTGLHKSRK